jgi:Asp-tRNA(Asn)/Glu-tRNA(Gln) amidotransferase A subunit family amidase
MPDLKKAGPGGSNLLTALQMTELLEAGATTSVALVEKCLARIKARDGDLHAWSHVDPEQALAQAQARDSEPRRSALHGVPVGIKDIFDTHDMPTTYGSSIYAGFQPTVDSVVVALMRRAGMVILGKCTTTEFASPVPIGVRNPHDLSRSPGMSSSGSAAAVADYMVPLAVGSQTGGSTILPAAYCGIVGYKSTLTGIDRGNIRHLRPTLDTIGLLARSVEDIACLRSILAGEDGHPLPRADIGTLRIGVCQTDQWQQVQPETVAAVEAAAGALSQTGAKVSEVVLPAEFDNIAESFRIISAIEAARALAYEAREHSDRLNFWIRDSLVTAKQFDLTSYEKAQWHALKCQRALGEIFGKVDVLLTPSVPGEAPADLDSISNSVFNRTWTLMQAPCVTLPTATGPNGMPVGIQLVGPVGRDVKTLSAAKAIADLLCERDPLVFRTSNLAGRDAR